MFMCDRTCDLFKVGNFNIKRCLLFLVCIMLLVACGENDPIESRNRHPRQQEESHSEQSGSVPAVAKEDVAAYFRFDMSRDINVALGLVEAQMSLFDNLSFSLQPQLFLSFSRLSF